MSKKTEKDKEQFELFQRVRPQQMQTPWDSVLKFRPDGAKSATQRAIERLGMLQGVCTRVIVVEGEEGGTWYTDQFNRKQDAISFITGEHFPPRVETFEVLDGRRRALDSFNAKDTTLAAMCFPADANERTVAAAAAVLNIARKPNPLQEAQSLQRLLTLGMDREQIADTLGIPLQTIKKRLRLLTLPEAFQEAIAQGTIKPGVAERVANLNSIQVDALEKILTAKGNIKGTDVKTVQEVQKSKDMSTLGSQLNIGFEVDPDALTTSMDNIRSSLDKLQAAIDANAEGVLLKAAEAMFRSGIKFTHIRGILSTLNHQIKQEA